jgi:hypothetical protein
LAARVHDELLSPRTQLYAAVAFASPAGIPGFNWICA